MDLAECRGLGPSQFVPSVPEHGRTKKPSDEARAVCARCSVRAECLDYGLTHQCSGLWGGRMLIEGNFPSYEQLPDPDKPPAPCSRCGVPLTDDTAAPSTVKHGSGLCRACTSEKGRRARQRAKERAQQQEVIVGQHGTCATCHQLLTPETATPSILKRGNGKCRACAREYGLRRRSPDWVPEAKGPAKRPVPLCTGCKEPLTLDIAAPSIVAREMGNCRACAAAYMRRRYWRRRPRQQRPGLQWVRRWDGSWRQLPALPPEERPAPPPRTGPRRGRRPLPRLDHDEVET